MLADLLPDGSSPCVSSQAVELAGRKVGGPSSFPFPGQRREGAGLRERLRDFKMSAAKAIPKIIIAGMCAFVCVCVLPLA